MANHLNCPVCNLQLEFKYKRAFLNHIRQHDQLLQIKWPLKCGQISCAKTFSNAIMYKKHVVKHISDLNKDENLKNITRKKLPTGTILFLTYLGSKI